MTDARAYRHRLREAGFCCIPLHGKKPALKQWQKLHEVTAELVDMYSKSWPDAANTGCLTRLMPTLDADILDEPAVRAIENHVREHFEERGYVLPRVGKPPKLAIPFRVNAEETFKKISVPLIAPDGSEGQKIEFLADGEQVVVAGIHPDTKQPYRWLNGQPGEIKLEDLPYIREAEARALVDELVDLLERGHGYKQAPTRKTTNGAKPAPHDGGGGGDSDWGQLSDNILAGRELHDSIRDLAAKLIASGMKPGAAVNFLRGLMDRSAAPKDDRHHARVLEIPTAVDSAVAKFARPARSSSEPEVEEPEEEPESAPASPEPKLPPRLRATHNVFRKWLGTAYDMDVLDAVLAAGAAERLSGDPLWLLVISGPGNAKTETVAALSGAGAIIISTIASEGALLSATSRKSKAKGATGGLLRKLGDRGILVIKDVTTILSTDRHARGPVLAAIREIYDGRWDRNVGTDGGQTLTWTGRIVIVGAVTTAWDAAHSVISTMGDRFVIVRSDSSSGRATSAEQAIENTGSETEMRKALAQVTGKLIEHMDKKGHTLDKAQRTRLIKAADIVTAARTGVERDYRGDVIDAHALEMPTRFAKQLGQLVRGAVAIGLPADRAMQLAIRCARDSIPPLRCQILLDIAANPKAEPHEVHRRIGRPRHTVRRELEALHMLRLLQCEETDETNDKGKYVRTIYEYSLGKDFDRATLLAMTAPAPPEDERVV